jgi:hypothetical protein
MMAPHQCLDFEAASAALRRGEPVVYRLPPDLATRFASAAAQVDRGNRAPSRGRRLLHRLPLLWLDFQLARRSRDAADLLSLYLIHSPEFRVAQISRDMSEVHLWRR